MSLPLGLLLDKYGAFWCRFACALFITLGLVHFLLAITDRNLVDRRAMNQSGLVLLFFVDMEPMLLFPAIPCLGAGGFTLLTSKFQLAMLTNIAGLVVLAIQAGFGASGTIFRVFFSGE